MAEGKAPSSAHWKLRAIKLSNANTPLANQEIRYRSVFDEAELTYLYVELSLFNKRFDEEDWELNYEVKIYDNFGTLLTSLPKKMNVSKDTNILYIREGWGNQTGDYYKKGVYRFEVWIEGIKIGEASATILKEGFTDPAKNPYFEIQSLRLFENPAERPPPAERRYLTQANGATARYITAELTAKHLRKKDDAWPCQLFFNFYYDTGELKGFVESFARVAPDENTFVAHGGWGSPSPGTWKADNYRLEVVFMDQLIAVVPFSVGDREILAGGETGWAPTQPQTKGIPAPASPPTLEALNTELAGLVGLSSIKTRVQEVTQYLGFLKLRQGKGLAESAKIDLNAVFTGNPGTGKTTVARLLGGIYHQLGLLSKGQLVEVDRVDLVGKYIGHTAPLVKEAINKARGGVLFIDEAYSLARGDDDFRDFGREVIEILLRELSDGPGDLAVFVAGYPQPMKVFLDSNPGLRSRFVTHFEFPDYTPEELLAIGERVAQKRGVAFSPEARALLEQALLEGYRKRDASFGNARFVTGVVDGAKLGLGVRLMKEGGATQLSEQALSTIQAVDMQRVLAPRKRDIVEIPVQEGELHAAVCELKALTGLNEIKHAIDDLVKLVRYYRETGKSLHKTFALHTVFTGSPGTGKTTVARLLARVFKALGLLERGHLVECDRQALVAGYTGQTAIKTGKVLDQAHGGVLFIDEAYSLVHDAGSEAIEVLLKRMEDARGDLAVVVAGYTQQMEQFMSVNPGLKSRFDRTFHFADYTPIELYEITLSMLKREDLAPDVEASRQLLRHWQSTPAGGNARSVRKLVEASVKRQHLRLSQLSKEARSPEAVGTVLVPDLALEVVDSPDERPSLGFKV